MTAMSGKAAQPLRRRNVRRTSAPATRYLSHARLGVDDKLVLAHVDVCQRTSQQNPDAKGEGEENRCAGGWSRPGDDEPQSVGEAQSGQAPGKMARPGIHWLQVRVRDQHPGAEA